MTWLQTITDWKLCARPPAARTLCTPTLPSDFGTLVSKWNAKLTPVLDPSVRGWNTDSRSSPCEFASNCLNGFISQSSQGRDSLLLMHLFPFHPFPWLCLAVTFCAFSSCRVSLIIFLVAEPDWDRLNTQRNSSKCDETTVYRRVSLVCQYKISNFLLNDECGLNLLYVPWLIHWSRWGSCSRPPVWLWALCLAVFPGQQCGPCELMYACLSREKEDTPLWREEQIWRWHDCKRSKL